MSLATNSADPDRKAEDLSGDQSAYSPQEAGDNIPAGTRVKVIVNPASGVKGGITTNPAGPDEVRRLLGANNIEADIFETEYPRHATELAKAAIKEGYDICVACGGDGTVGEVATGLIRSKVTLGILPLGSANNVARMLHVPFDLEEAAKLLRLGEIRNVDVGRCNGRYFLETAGVGLDAALFPILNRVDKGEYIRLIDVARTFFKFRPRSVTLVLDGRAVRLRALVVLVANGPYWGYSVPLAPDAKVDDRRFDVVVFRNFSKSAFIRHVLAALLGRGAEPDPRNPHGRNRPAHHPDIRTYRAKRVQVLTSRRRPWPVHADAQARGYTPARIEVVPGALRVITGPGEHVTTHPSRGTPRGKPPKHRLRDG
ncbi:MAG: diacylglycerol kinase family lipid kinase [Chloroflexota bacterium]|nr:diacylglycerol kinase family lipid kinase [Chloroflexota bacterium]